MSQQKRDYLLRMATILNMSQQETHKQVAREFNELFSDIGEFMNVQTVQLHQHILF